jgi:hypothetical protein
VLVVLSGSEANDQSAEESSRYLHSNYYNSIFKSSIKERMENPRATSFLPN